MSEPTAYTEELMAKADELVGRYPHPRSALLPLLHLVQYADGYITDAGVALCADRLGLTKAEVAAVATFYSMYKREPLGRHLVSVCTNFSCQVRGAGEVYQRLSAKLGVGHNETTADGALTLEHAECLGNCEGAPVVTVDYLNYECQTPESAEALVDQLLAGERPAPTRGMPPEGMRAVSHRLAGLGPPDVEGVAGDVGRACSQARADDGALPPVESGPGTVWVPVEPTFAVDREAQRAQARQAVREAGADPDEVEASAGASAREFPTTPPDWEPTVTPRPAGDASTQPQGDDAEREGDDADPDGDDGGGADPDGDGAERDGGGADPDGGGADPKEHGDG